MSGISRNEAAMIGCWLTLVTMVCGCAGPIVRPYYNREAGAYVSPTPNLTPTAVVPEELSSASFSWGANSEGKSDANLKKIAESYLGVPYSSGGQSRAGMDCSGFIRQVFEEAFGQQLPHSSAKVFRMGKRVEKSDLRPGDLVFFKNHGAIDHSGIYMGANYFIHSASSVGVAYSTLDAPYFNSHYAGARRLSEDKTSGNDSVVESPVQLP